MKSFLPTQPEDSVRKWVIVDVKNQVLGRVAATIANILRGKHRPTFTPHLDMGDFVVVLNAAKVKLTGKKNTQKVYWRYSGYRGGYKEQMADVVRERHPERMIYQAVRGMLPHNRLSRGLIKRLKIYPGEQHPHAAQKPEVLKLG